MVEVFSVSVVEVVVEVVVGVVVGVVVQRLW